MTCFILSAGEQRRFNTKTPKQLLTLAGESIMCRQLRQLGRQGVIPTVVCVHPDIKMQAVQSMAPSQRTTILHSLLSTSLLWQGRVIVLLGDVFFSDAVLDDILANQQPVRFWLSGSEIYAFAFAEDQHDHIRNSIEACLKRFPIVKPDAIRMWHLYRQLNGLDIHQHRVIESEITGPLVSDCTDIDSEQHYEDLKRQFKG